MAYRRDRVFILKKEAVRDYDRRYTLYGRDHGICTAFARGCSRPKSRQAGHLEPFCDTEVMMAHGRFVDHLAVAYRGIGAPNMPYEGYLLLGRFSDLVTRMVRPGVPDSRLYDLLIELRSVAGDMPGNASVIRMRFVFAGAVLKLLDLLGFAPPFEEEGAREEMRCGEEHLRVLRLLRHGQLRDALRLTAEEGVLDFVCSYIEHLMYSTYLHEEFEGSKLFSSFCTYV